MAHYAVFHKDKQIRTFPYDPLGKDWVRARILAIEFAEQAERNGYAYTVEQFGASGVGIVVWNAVDPTEVKTWEQFNTRYRAVQQGRDPLDFYGCVDANGEWFDSSDSFEIAVHWCCYAAGQYDLSNEGEIEWMTEEGHKLGYSIIHGTMLKQMYEKGLIK